MFTNLSFIMPIFGLIRHKIISIRKMIMLACAGKTPSILVNMIRLGCSLFLYLDFRQCSSFFDVSSFGEANTSKLASISLSISVVVQLHLKHLYFSLQKIKNAMLNVQKDDAIEISVLETALRGRGP